MKSPLQSEQQGLERLIAFWNEQARARQQLSDEQIRHLTARVAALKEQQAVILGHKIWVDHPVDGRVLAHSHASLLESIRLEGQLNALERMVHDEKVSLHRDLSVANEKIMHLTQSLDEAKALGGDRGPHNNTGP